MSDISLNLSVFSLHFLNYWYLPYITLRPHSLRCARTAYVAPAQLTLRPHARPSPSRCARLEFTLRPPSAFSSNVFPDVYGVLYAIISMFYITVCHVVGDGHVYACDKFLVYFYEVIIHFGRISGRNVGRAQRIRCAPPEVTWFSPVPPSVSNSCKVRPVQVR